MPFGGDITALSMLPVCFVAIKFGVKQGLALCFLFAVFQFFYGFFTLIPLLQTPFAFAVCIAFDYLIPYTLLGLAGLSRNAGYAGKVLSVAAVIFLGFLCHFLSGVTIWGQFAPEGMSAALYSLVYNGSYMGIELIITVAGAAALFKLPQIQKFLLEEKQ
jgi:thiamine transporter